MYFTNQIFVFQGKSKDRDFLSYVSQLNCLSCNDLCMAGFSSDHAINIKWQCLILIGIGMDIYDVFPVR